MNSGSQPARTGHDDPGTDKVYIADLCSDCRVASYFVCETKEVATTRDGRAFLKLVLRDASGNVKALHFDPSDDILEDLCAGDVVKVAGAYSVSPQYGPQIKVQQIATLTEGEYDPSTLVPVSPVPLAELEQRLTDLIGSVAHPGLQGLLRRTLDPQAEPGATYRVAPAAVRHHHAYMHGLLEHSIVVAEVAAAVADRTPSVDRDMVVTGGLLHDLGKTQAYSSDPFRPGLTDKGRLHGEIVLGQTMVAELLRDRTDVTDDQAMRLLHVIVSHHGEREKGSPAVPMTREAIIVHYADDMTARLAAFHEAEAATPVDDHWTAYNRMMETALYVGSVATASAADDSPVPAAEDELRAGEAHATETRTAEAAPPPLPEEAPVAENEPPAAAALFD